MWTIVLSALTSRVAAMVYAGCVVALTIACGVTVLERDAARHSLAKANAAVLDLQATVEVQKRSISQLQGAVQIQDAAIQAAAAEGAKGTKAANAALQAARRQYAGASAYIATLLNTPLSRSPDEACKAGDAAILDFARKH